MSRKFLLLIPAAALLVGGGIGAAVALTGDDGGGTTTTTVTEPIETVTSVGETTPSTETTDVDPATLIDAVPQEDAVKVKVGAFEPATEYTNNGEPLDGVQPTLGNAIATFGPPASSKEDQLGGTCTTEWPNLALRAVSADLSAGIPCGDSAGVNELIAIGLGAERWATAAGLRVGDDEARIRELYRDAYVSADAEHTVVLVDQYSPIGDGGQVPRLAAGVYDGRVESLIAFIYGAGE